MAPSTPPSDGGACFPGPEPRADPQRNPPIAVQPTPFHDLIERARGGEDEAQDALFRQFYPVVQRLVHKSLARDLRLNRPWLSARFSTGDIVQEVFRSVLRDIPSFAGTNEGAMVGYLTIIVRNRIVDAMRFHEAERRDGRRGESGAEAELAASAHDDPAQLAARADEMRCMQRALLQLPEREQLLVRARFEGEESFQSLSLQLGYGSESAARRAFHAAQARLAIVLSGNDVEGGSGE